MSHTSSPFMKTVGFLPVASTRQNCVLQKILSNAQENTTLLGKGSVQTAAGRLFPNTYFLISHSSLQEPDDHISPDQGNHGYKFSKLALLSHR